MVRSLRELFCFSSGTPSPQESSPNITRLRSIRSIRNATTKARFPRSPRHSMQLTKTAPQSSPVTSSPTTISTCVSTLASEADSHASKSSATSHSPTSFSDATPKLPTIPSEECSTPYFSILQPDGTLKAPQISFGGYGAFGGRFAPESIMGFLSELTSFFEATVSDASFWSEFASHQRAEPTPLQMAGKLTDLAGGATIWLKREDQNEYGTHKTRNIIGQLLLARRMGRTEIVTECAAAKHGSFAAAMCARLGLRCVVVMGADDAQAQPEDILEMKLLGAKIVTARTPSGMGTLRAAITEALRYSVCNHETAYYLMGSPVGPSPLPTITRTFQALLGEEVAAQMHEAAGCQPDAVVTAVGSGSSAVGLFQPFIHLPAVRLVAVEAARAATLTEGDMGVLQGARTLMLQNPDGQILDSHSISPDLNLSTVGPEVAHWKDSGRIEIQTATDADALDGFKTLQHHEGFLPGLDSSHAVGPAVDLARQLGPGKNLVLLVTGSDNISTQRGLDA
ncbi:hypothetical protein N7492_009606 [Penicillium capsulatum]|uniref:tryptophan synthase n=1 Tax=Penicillium capsulatum TaxID=69766 RepID=A0A9W9HS32_9EURO|nr:hypothetical protein N7492_009606 [Penicillium capsulatum]KAJ6106994.1 hypothetical protein N7512_010511 [Penicillium capsulatum]